MMIAAVGGGSKPKEVDAAEQEALPSVPTSKIEVLGEATPPKDTSEVVVFGEAVPPEDTSGSVPPAEDPVLGVARVNEVGAAVGPLELAFPSLMTPPETQGVSYGLSYYEIYFFV